MNTITPIDKSNFVLEAGDYINNGAIVLECRQTGHKRNGLYASWIAVCMWERVYPNHKSVEYVVWDVIARPEGFVAERGDYYSSIIPAVDCFVGRGGRK
jgi:hypothetical protein